MRLEDIKEHLKGCRIVGDGGAEFTKISCDSRLVTGPGTIFAALTGERLDGRSFIKDAVTRGASCVLTDRPSDISRPGNGVAQIIVSDVREALARISSLLCGEPSRSLKLVGITGTNGKTTTTYLLESIFREAGLKAGVMGTVNYRFAERVTTATHTTPGAPELQRILKEMKDSGVTHCAMEVSSHALDQKRVNGCRFDAVVFTNLTHEHLDYHQSIEAYFAAKRRLFGLLKEGVGRAVINIDDPWGKRLEGEAPGALTYSLAPGADIYPMGKEFSTRGIEALVVTPDRMMAVSSALVGEYNLQNIIAAVAVGCALGIDPLAIEKGIAALKRVPGRLERINTSTPELSFNAYVDYAHTPDALERTIRALGEVTTGRVITVFGCGGNRDRLKRPEMGRIATELSGITIITSDNPRNEDPIAIIREIEAGIKDVKRYEEGDGRFLELSSGEKGYCVIPGRGEAIRRAVTAARAGDSVLIAGKGHEDYQIVGDKRLHFDDREVLEEALNALGRD